MKFPRLLPPIAAALICSAAFADGESPPARFSFIGPAADAVAVAPSDVYSPEKGYGFDLGSTPKVAAGALNTGDKRAALFSVKLNPGVYQVAVTLGGDDAADTTIKSETRRLMAEKIRTAAGAQRVVTFLVHVRIPTIPGATGDAAHVRFKPREADPILFVQWDLTDGKDLIPFTELDWDEKLTLEFAGDEGTKAAVKAVDIRPAGDHTTVFLVGDSTMTDQMMEPWAAWGQQFPRFLAPPVVVANYAECGETTASFVGERRWAKVMSQVKKGDYVFIQFGINDQRMKLDDFKNYFLRFIDDVKAAGATPVLVTSQNLENRSLGQFPQAMRDAASEKSVPLIDLNAMSEKLYAAEGPNLKKLFVDGTHHTAYGSYELCKCVVQGIRDAHLPIAQNIVPDFTTFDPAHPDDLNTFQMVVDPQMDPARPGGPGAPNGQGPMAAPRSAPRPARNAAARPATRPAP